MVEQKQTNRWMEVLGGIILITILIGIVWCVSGAKIMVDEWANEPQYSENITVGGAGWGEPGLPYLIISSDNVIYYTWDGQIYNYFRSPLHKGENVTIIFRKWGDTDACLVTEMHRIFSSTPYRMCTVGTCGTLIKTESGTA